MDAPFVLPVNQDPRALVQLRATMGPEAFTREFPYYNEHWNEILALLEPSNLTTQAPSIYQWLPPPPPEITPPSDWRNNASGVINPSHGMPLAILPAAEAHGTAKPSVESLGNPHTPNTSTCDKVIIYFTGQQKRNIEKYWKARKAVLTSVLVSGLLIIACFGIEILCYFDLLQPATNRFFGSNTIVFVGWLIRMLIDVIRDYAHLQRIKERIKITAKLRAVYMCAMGDQSEEFHRMYIEKFGAAKDGGGDTRSASDHDENSIFN